MFKSKKIKKSILVSSLVLCTLSSNLVFGANLQEGLESSFEAPSHEEKFEIDKEILKSYEGDSSVVVVPEGVKSIAFGAFMNKDKIEKIVLPESLEFIDQYAFYSCTSLKEINIPDKVERIGDLAFGNCKSCKFIHIGKGLKFMEKFVFCNCESLKKISVDPENSNFSSYRGMLYSKDFSEFILCPASRVGNIKLHENTKSINSYSFALCKGVITVSRSGNKPMSVFDAAFFGCENFIGLDFFDSIVLIGPGAFINCFSLKEFTIGKNVKRIGSSAFLGCGSLDKVTVKPKNVEIGNKIFRLCSKKITVIADEDSTMAEYARLHPKDLVLK